MHVSLPISQKKVLRLLAWGTLFVLACAICQNLAYADERQGVVEEVNNPTSWWAFFLEIMPRLFDSKALMHVLAKPEFTVVAFVALNVIIFTETGLLLGFFLPGDSLLVITGLICANPACGWNLPLLLFTLCVSAVVGDSVGYAIGYKTGPKIFNREKSFFFHKDHLLKAQQFYEKHGGKTIVLARFMPILRTFAPVVAGVGRMQYRSFIFFNVFGGVSWVISMVLAGYFLPDLLNRPLSTVFGPDFLIQDHVEKVVIIVVFLSILPGILAWLKTKLTRPVPAATAHDPALTVGAAK